MWKQIYDQLKAANLNPYATGQHQGLCESPYVVIREGSQIPSLQSNRVGQKVIDIIILVPARSYLELEIHISAVRAAMKELDFLRKTGLETMVVEDDQKKAYTMSIQYVSMKKLEG